MFVVGIVQRAVAPASDETPEAAPTFIPQWPVVFEHDGEGYVTDKVAVRESREAAQQLADALNAALVAT